MHKIDKKNNIVKTTNPSYAINKIYEGLNKTYNITKENNGLLIYPVKIKNQPLHYKHKFVNLHNVEKVVHDILNENGAYFEISIN